MTVIAIANQKGGVGKTTTAVNLAACLARDGRRVLLIDLDHQANATDHLGVEPPEEERHSSWALIAERDPDFASLLRPAGPNLVLAPASVALADVDLDLASALSRERRLAYTLRRLEGDYDYAILDCPPSLGLVTLNALAAARRVLITIQTNRWAFSAQRRILKLVAELRDEINPSLGFYALATMHRTNVIVHREVLEKMREHFEEIALSTIIRFTATLPEAASARQTIVDYAEGSKAHLDYKQLAAEIDARLRSIDGQTQELSA